MKRKSIIVGISLLGLSICLAAVGLILTAQNTPSKAAHKFVDAVIENDFEKFKECIGEDQIEQASPEHLDQWFQIYRQYAPKLQQLDGREIKVMDLSNEMAKDMYDRGRIFVYDDAFPFYMVHVPNMNISHYFYDDGWRCYMLLPTYMLREPIQHA